MDIYITGEHELLTALVNLEFEQVAEFDNPQIISTQAQPLNCPSGMLPEVWTVGAVVLLALKTAPDILKFATELVNFLKVFRKKKGAEKNIVINLRLDDNLTLAVSDESDPRQVSAQIKN